MRRHPKRARCCPKGGDYIRWMTAGEADDDVDGYYISLHCGYPDPVYELVTVCPFCGASVDVKDTGTVPCEACASKDTYTEVTVPRRVGNAQLKGGTLVACRECGYVRHRPWGWPARAGEAGQ